VRHSCRPGVGMVESAQDRSSHDDTTRVGHTYSSGHRARCISVGTVPPLGMATLRSPTQMGSGRDGQRLALVLTQQSA
jgi:hypothetical protein